MRRYPKPRLSPARASALALAALAGLMPLSSEAQQISNIVVFGDSSADLGSQGPERRPTNQGQMWSERLAEQFGKRSSMAREFRVNEAGDGVDVIRKGGNNYAVNGSTILPYDCCLTLEQQIDFFVEDRGKFDKDDLTFIWMTRNDITTAIPDGLPYSAAAYAQAHIRQVERLRSLGARNIVAFGAETDLLAEQFGLDNGASPESLEILREETRAAERALWPGLQRNGVYIIDVNKLGKAVLDDPAKYGFRSTSDSYQLRDQYLAGGRLPIDDQDQPDDGNVFTVDGHFTSAMQALTADYTVAQLRAREQLASVLKQSALTFRQSREAGASMRMRDRTRDLYFFAAPIAGQLSLGAPGPMASQLDNTFAGLTVGAETALGERTWLGGTVTLNRNSGSFGSGLGKTDSTFGAASGYVETQLAPWLSVVADGAVGWTDFNRIERRARLGKSANERVQGATDAIAYSAGLHLRSQIPLGDWMVSGSAGLTFERTELSGYAEKAGILALHYGTSRYDAALGQFNLRIARQSKDAWFRPFAALSFTHDFTDDPIRVKAGPTASTIVSYSTSKNLKTSLGGELGFTAVLRPDVALQFSLSHQHWFDSKKDSSATAMRLALSKRF